MPVTAQHKQLTHRVSPRYGVALPSLYLQTIDIEPGVRGRWGRMVPRLLIAAVKQLHCSDRPDGMSLQKLHGRCGNVLPKIFSAHKELRRIRAFQFQRR
jgi:hypothetical protein